jgi:hypothetical protein
MRYLALLTLVACGGYESPTDPAVDVPGPELVACDRALFQVSVCYRGVALICVPAPDCESSFPSCKRPSGRVDAQRSGRRRSGVPVNRPVKVRGRAVREGWGRRPTVHRRCPR